MNRPDFRTSYERHTSELARGRDTQSAMRQVAGGNFEAVGKLECALLLQYELDRSDTVIDVGCGSGRLGFQLRKRLDGRYVGIDVVRDLFEYAQRIVNVPTGRSTKRRGCRFPRRAAHPISRQPW